MRGVLVLSARFSLGVKILLKLLLVQDVFEFLLLLVQEAACVRVCLNLSAVVFVLF